MADFKLTYATMFNPGRHSGLRLWKRSKITWARNMG
jgi:hypothetical protein